MKVENIARKICGAGECACAYEVCSNPDLRISNPLQQLGADKVCPLTKYHCEPIPKPTNRADLLRYWQSTRVTVTECNTLCHHCEHFDCDDDGLQSTDEYFAHCLDCPVNRTREAIQEMEAEAAMS